MRAHDFPERLRPTYVPLWVVVGLVLLVAAFCRSAEAQWVGASSGWVRADLAASSTSPLTTKGDLHGYSTTDARLAVGANDLCLVADSTQPLGLKWAACGGLSGGTANRLAIWTGAGTMSSHAGLLADATTGVLTIGAQTDVVPVTLRASAAPGTAHILQWQTALNGALGHLAHDGSVTAPSASLGVASTTTGQLSLFNAGSAHATILQAGAAAAARTYTWPTNFGAAGTVLTDAAGNGTLSWAAPAGGITNSAGANVLPKSDGTNLVASALNEASAGAITTDAGVALSLTATPPAATTGASQAGKDTSLTASDAVASTDTDGAAAGGPVTIESGAAARRTSGNANGGDINLTTGPGIGTGAVGNVVTNGRFLTSGGSTTIPNFGATGLTNGLTVAASGVSIIAGSVEYQRSTAAAFTLSNSLAFGATAAAPDLYLRRKGAANPAWGAASATPVAYTHSMAADGTGTDIAGANAALGPGNGTGTGGSGVFRMQTAYPGATGTTANTAADRIMLGPKWTTLTAETPTNLATIAFAASSSVTAELFVLIEARDASNGQAMGYRVHVNSVRDAAGNTISTTAVIGTPAVASGTGTLTCTFAAVEGATAVTVTANCTSSLTETTLRANLQAQGNGAETITQL